MTTGTSLAQTLTELRLVRIREIDAEIAELKVAEQSCCDAIKNMPEAPLGEYGYRRWSDSINRWEARSIEFANQIKDLERRRDMILGVQA